MKIIIKKILPILGVLFLLNACTDLDTDVKSEYTEENFPITQADMEAVCGPAYSRFKGAYGRNFWLMVTGTTDEATMVTNDNNWYDKGYYGEFALHTWTYDNSMTTGAFEELFTCISTCNQILTILEKAPETEYRAQAMAEIKTMRALYYFWAMDNFGRLPIIDKFGITAPPQSSRKEVAEFIKKELIENTPSLSTKVDKTTYGKPTQYMAKALLAKLYLNWGVYTAADISNYEPSDSNKDSNTHLDDLVAVCDEIIQSNAFELGNDWLAKFKPNNGANIKDFIFAFPYNWNLADGNIHSRFWGHKFFEFTFGMKRKPSGPLRAIPEFVDKYNLPGDVRNKIWRGGPQYYEDNPTKPYIVKISKKTLDKYYKGTDGDAIVEWHFELTKDLVVRGNTPDEITENTRKLDLAGDELGLAMGYRNVKFYPTTYSTNYDQDNDIPIFRYADILLMKAEAILRGATPTLGHTAASLVNQIRECAQAPSVDNITLDELLDERAREFADEYWRRNDLIRFGKFEDDWGLKKAILGTSNKDKYRRVFSIPLKFMQLNPTWTQNPGYTK
ncbi:RagB/SusD family nutrient uptake outer membrane protein [Dysgonomonas sp. Marseille-P4677]|uniref:RagB/SusD family nutrient uptake outer membrane protein n=1 Tax=Dysgonomonas sp. Marseille-P4677 TaxID=2364790 RepID=UPI001911A155|nr:RagB/SusD family nutrient uptake outer membrane protein [Dysgonomonas sp. Marseille-P4677]MBK5720642.1 RagB/SusD family nutrient uptake outer membrane protein [Dysgonomonas sp. Marseille-P4677]